MDLGLDRKVVVVAGAGSGIGRATANLLAAEGAVVVAVDLDTSALRPDDPERWLNVQRDLTHEAAARVVVDATIERFGRVDALVNCVGALRRRADFCDVSDDDWHWAFEVNLLPSVRLIRAVVPHMSQRGRGAIVNVASDQGRQPVPMFVDYAAMKAALISLTKSLSVELGPYGVRANIVSPGPTRTDAFVAGFEHDLAPAWGLETEAAIAHFVEDVQRIPIGRLGVPDEVARVIVFLASDASSQVTGSEYCVDGGIIRAC